MGSAEACAALALLQMAGSGRGDGRQGRGCPERARLAAASAERPKPRGPFRPRAQAGLPAPNPQHVKNSKHTNKYEGWPEALEMEGCIPRRTTAR